MATYRSCGVCSLVMQGPPGGYGGHGAPPGGWGQPPGGGGWGQPPGGPPAGWGQPPPAPYGAPAGYGSPHGAYPGGPMPPPKKKSLTWVWILVGLVVAGFGGCGVCVALLPEEDPAVVEKRVEERRDTLEATLSRLKKLRKNFPEVAGLKEKKCKESDIPERASDKPHHVVDYDYLAKFTEKDFEEVEGWSFLTTSSIREFVPLADQKQELDSLAVGNMVHSLSYLEAGRIIVVLRGTESKSLPELDGNDEFVMGDFQGWAVVFDYVDGKPLCQVPLAVESSESVTHIEGGLLGKTPEEAITADFQDRFRKELQKALGKISKKVQPDL